MNKVYIVGIGPGSEEYVLPIAKKAIEHADCLIGAKRLLSVFKYPDKEKIYLEGKFGRAISVIKEKRKTKNIAVLVSGDPGLYSFSANIARHFKKSEYEVIPGISSLQLAFARIKESWHDTEIVSIHGRPLTGLINKALAPKKLFLFTDGDFSPNKIASYLLNRGPGNRKAFVFENLSYPDERIIETDLKKLSKMQGFKQCVMLIEK